MGRSKSDRWEEGESEGRPAPEQVDRTLTWANTAAAACRTARRGNAHQPYERITDVSLVSEEVRAISVRY